jgi:hypothetical protein
LAHADKMDVRYSSHWKLPDLSHTVPDPEDGPVMVTVEYVIDPERSEEFLSAIACLEIQRRRDGAMQWYIFRDLEDEQLFYESFMVATWGEHMRQHEHVLMSDRIAEQNVDAFHIPAAKPLVRHYIAAQPNKSISVSRPLTRAAIIANRERQTRRSLNSCADWYNTNR